MKGTRRQLHAAANRLGVNRSRPEEALRVPRVPAEVLGSMVRELVAQLWESEQRHRLMFEQSAIGMAYATLDGCFVDANASWCALVGCSREELPSLSLADLTAGTEHERHAQLRRELLTGKIASYTLETCRALSAGRILWLRLLVSIGRSGGGEPLYLLASAQDITAVKEAEERQALAQASYAAERASLELAQDELRGQLRAAAQATASLEQFLATASHELLTPVTIIQASIQLHSRRLRRRAASGQSGERAVDLELLEQAQAQVQALSRVLEDMAQVARAGAGALELRIERIELVALVRGVVAAQRLAHPERDILLAAPEAVPEAVPEHDGLVVLADADRIAQVVMNYLNNALKYSPPERPIRVEVGLGSGAAERESNAGTGLVACVARVARVAVRDEGIGIAPEEQARVWERFHRVPGVRTHTRDGANLGLGLHICKSIVEQHAGAVGLISILGAGSTFSFSLPLAPDALSTARRASEHGHTGNAASAAGVE